ncbi:MAG: hypothetical protein SF069_06590 [Phycisphaerae bacterium]|nr:hypothetical protein [Phycisphaerae bacterium]
MFSETFNALIREAQFTSEVLGAGATQIRLANYATTGVYFQAFTSLSTGLERIGKLCLLVDHCIEHNGQFPTDKQMKGEIGHNIGLIYEKSQQVILKRSIVMKFLANLNDPIHLAILKVLTGFATGDRYCNINLVVGAKAGSDPVSSWFETVDIPLYAIRTSERLKKTINTNAAAIAAKFDSQVSVVHTSETGTPLIGLAEASRRTGVFKAVAPHRQLYVLQIIRYWGELLSCLQHTAMTCGISDIPYFSEIFAPYCNDDSYFRRRKTWTGL